MIRKLVVLLKCSGGRKYRITVLLMCIATSLLLLSWPREDKILTIPLDRDEEFSHFRRCRDLEQYLDNTGTLVEPSVVCEHNPGFLVLVASAPHHVEQRAAIRETWGKHQPTYFVMGIQSGVDNDSLVDNFFEAKLHSDLIIFDFRDHYQNLTLKTALMLEWTSRRCSNVEYLFKTDDDVFMNPYTMKKVLEDHDGAHLIGHSWNNTFLHRDENVRWYVPRWLHNDDFMPQFLSGSGYLIKGNIIYKILQEAKRTPIINLEDVYITAIVCKNKLNLTLTHDFRLSPSRPWLDLDCLYWTLAKFHRMTPDDIRHAWRIIKRMSNYKYVDVCRFFKMCVKPEWLLS